MKTKYLKTNRKDNIAAAAVLAATAVAILGAVLTSTETRAHHVPLLQMEAIVVSAPRIAVARMDTIVVTASREANMVIAAN